VTIVRWYHNIKIVIVVLEAVSRCWRYWVHVCGDCCRQVEVRGA
jgi:hypothetical protein